MSKENPYLRKLNSYQRDDDGNLLFDVYDVIVGFNVCNPGLQHALKKILTAGQRGVEKNVCDDIRESIQSLKRALEIEKTMDQEAYERGVEYMEQVRKEMPPEVAKEFPTGTQTAYKVTLEPEINKEAFMRP